MNFVSGLVIGALIGGIGAAITVYKILMDELAQLTTGALNTLAQDPRQKKGDYYDHP